MQIEPAGGTAEEMTASSSGGQMLKFAALHADQFWTEIKAERAQNGQAKQETEGAFHSDFLFGKFLLCRGYEFRAVCRALTQKEKGGPQEVAPRAHRSLSQTDFYAYVEHPDEGSFLKAENRSQHQLLFESKDKWRFPQKQRIGGAEILHRHSFNQLIISLLCAAAKDERIAISYKIE